MIDDQRWLEGGDAPPEVAALLRGARRARALPAAARERSRRRLAGLTALPAAAGAFLWFQHAALGAVLGAMLTSAVVVPQVLSERAAARAATRAPSGLHPRPERSAPPPGGSLVPRPEDLPAEPAVGALPAAQSPLAAGAGVPRAAPRSSSVPSDPSPSALSAGHSPRVTERSNAVPAASEEHGLVREARLLERARALLATDPRGALALLEVHRSEFPQGTLTLERELLGVDASIRLGRRADAEARAARLRALSPGSLYAERLQQLLGPARLK